MNLELDIASTLQSAKDKLRASGDKNFGTDAEDLLGLALKKNWVFIKSSIIECMTRQNSNTPLANTASAKCLLTVEEYEEYFSLVTRRCGGEPMDSIFGYTKFQNLTIPFSKYTLTPRQETEIFASMAVDFLKVMQSNDESPLAFDVINGSAGNVFRMKSSQKLMVLDLCSGSGCIGISIATSPKLKDIKVVLSDISNDALDIAKLVVEQTKADNVEIVKSDLFENISGLFDVIVSNPPYIRTGEIETLEREVRNYDPIIALDGGKDGLNFYRRIIADAPKHLSSGGLIMFELGYGQSKNVAKMLSKDFENIMIFKDYAGIDRFIVAKKKSLEN